ncbi:MAG: hypothetical protein WBW79_04275 [Desulfocapsaceae bacterium]
MTGKKIAGKASFPLVRFFLFLSRILPQKASYAICCFVGSVAALPNWKRKRIALANLEIVFPEKTDAQRQAIFMKSLVKLLKNYFEICFLASGKWSSRDIEEAVTASGLEYLDELKESGKGALLYSGHFGNFPLMVIWLAMKGYPVAAIYKEAKNFPDDFFGNIMSRFGVAPLKYKSDPTLTTVIQRSLKEKKIVLIQNDQSHPHGVYIDFFDKSVPSLAGPALLSRRLGVPIIPAYIIRDTRDHHHLTILPEMVLKDIADREEFIIVNTQLQLDWIAGIVENHPTEWLWLHNRWKRAR